MIKNKYLLGVLSFCLFLGGPGRVYAAAATPITENFANTNRINTSLSNGYSIATGQLKLGGGAFGDGADGAVSITVNKNINVDSIAPGRTCADGISYSVTALTNTTATLNVGTIPSNCLTTGDEVLLINLQGTRYYMDTVGNYEFLTVQSVSSNVVTFTKGKSKYYGNTTIDDNNIGLTSTNQRVMLQRVPNYTNVDISAGVTLTASAWDGTKGGVLVFKAMGTVTVNGNISATSLGYGGGPVRTGYDGGDGGDSYCGVGGIRGYYCNPGCGASCGGAYDCVYGSHDSGAAGAAGGGSLYGTGSGGAGWCGAGGGGTAGAGTGGAGGLGGSGGGGSEQAAPGGGAGYGTAGTGGVGANGTANGANGGTNVSGAGGSSSFMSAGGGGGTYGDATLAKVYLGSGGGAGGSYATYHPAGGSGGGIIILPVNSLSVPGAGTIKSWGGSTTWVSGYGGASGGGSGGSIKIITDTASLGSSQITATGGTGGVGTYGTGGTGGSGRIRVEYVTSVSGTTSPAYSSYQGSFQYADSATITSKNFIAASNFVSSFVYTLSAKPAGTTAAVQFSPDNVSWYSSAGVLNGSDTLGTTPGTVISVASLQYTNFYYRILYTSDGTVSPAMTSVTINYAEIILHAPVTDLFTDTSKISTGLSSGYSIASGQLALATVNNFGSGADGTVVISANKNINTTLISNGRSYADGVVYPVSAIGSNTITAATTPNGIAAGDEVLLINLQGTPSNYASVGNYEFRNVQSVSGSVITVAGGGITTIYGAGSNSNLTGQKVVVQRVPNYSNLTISSGIILSANAWDGNTGGVLVFKVSGTFTNGGVLQTSGLGYRGSVPASSTSPGGEAYTGNPSGAYGGWWGHTGAPAPAGCGGGGGGEGVWWGTNGNVPGGPGSAGAACGGAGGTAGDASGNVQCSPGGGGGGGYGTPGGGGGHNGVAGGANVSGAGGAGSTVNYWSGGGGGGGSYGSAALTKLYFGSGGGAGGYASSWSYGNLGGAGGAGGGMVLVKAKTITGSGGIRSNGGGGGAGYSNATAPNGNSGAGGGGAGGSIYIEGDSVNVGTGVVTASAGAAGVIATGIGGAGGAGGVGRIVVRYQSSVSGTTSPAATQSQISLQNYITSAVITSTNFVASGNNIASFSYTLSSKPAGTTAAVQFSSDMTNWYDSTGTLNGSNTLTTTPNSTISLSDLQFTNFYYRILYTSDGAYTPALSYATVNYTTIVGDSSCNPNPGGNNYIYVDCTFPKMVSGVDSGTGGVNTAKIVVRSGVLTIIPNQVIAAGSLELSDTGSLLIDSEGQLLTSTPLWMVDADINPSTGQPTGDNYPDTLTEYAQVAQPAGAKRRNLMSALGTVDCSSSIFSTVNSCCTPQTWYRDADGDGYGNALVTTSACAPAPTGYVANNTDCKDTGTNAVRVMFSGNTCYYDSDNDNYGQNIPRTCFNTQSCATATWGSTGTADDVVNVNFATNTTDCYDLNANAYPGSAYCSATNRGDGGFDYNCSGTATICGNDVGPASYTVSGGWSERCTARGGCSCLWDTAVNGHCINGGQAACGAVGYIRNNYCNYNPSHGDACAAQWCWCYNGADYQMCQ